MLSGDFSMAQYGQNISNHVGPESTAAASTKRNNIPLSDLMESGQVGLSVFETDEKSIILLISICN